MGCIQRTFLLLAYRTPSQKCFWIMIKHFQANNAQWFVILTIRHFPIFENSSKLLTTHLFWISVNYTNQDSLCIFHISIFLCSLRWRYVFTSTYIVIQCKTNYSFNCKINHSHWKPKMSLGLLIQFKAYGKDLIHVI